MKWKKGYYIVSDNPALIDLDTVVELLSNTFWAACRPKHIVEKSIHNSICFGLFYKNNQIGFARVVTDKAVLSWLCDVIIRQDFRGQGLGKWMMECILEHPDIKNTKQFLATKYAHGFYERFGFQKDEYMKRAPVNDLLETKSSP